MTTLAPGESWSAIVPLFFGSQGWTLARAGRYRVRLEYASEVGKLSTRPQLLRVAPPRSAAEGQAAALMMRPAAAAFVYFGGPVGKDGGRDLLERLRKLDSKGPLAPYAEMVLGLAETTPTFDPATASFRPARCVEEAPQLAQTVGRVADPLLAARGATALGRCLRESGRISDADAVVAALFNAHPEMRSFPGADSLFQQPVPSGRR